MAEQLGNQPVRTVVKCNKCGSREVEIRAWVSPNLDNAFAMYYDGNSLEESETCYCHQCGEWTQPIFEHEETPSVLIAVQPMCSTRHGYVPITVMSMSTMRGNRSPPNVTTGANTAKVITSSNRTRYSWRISTTGSSTSYSRMIRKSSLVSAKTTIPRQRHTIRPLPHTGKP